MPFEEQDYRDLRKRLEKGKWEDRRIGLAHLKQAEVAMAQLTGLAEWKTFMQMIQSKIDDTQAHLDACKEAMVTERMSMDDLQQARRVSVSADCRLSTLKEIQSLPALIMGKEDTPESV